ncbi:iron dependent repressor, metal binding and dimerization domain protein [Anaerococcus obesiensis]|nr:iron dependent repressor, metal binding and dimerization domain protein [Anaerococcus obesiensis]
MYKKHMYLTSVFIKLGVNPKQAESEACLIEHVISDETFKKLKKHFNETL